ncbi:glutaredoxin family protein [Actinopolymorpha singaporensis]|uniref:Glutaredoxin n=1 Tax=Actinopolymorpha singaporensis TaxID=117157 RepID=A0A1H1QNF8_9ACTN|nr:glutaredoxin family protein [Actinopolymorpha singaporensis]SDS24974.1 Glutaredoxin [Actinopolymorpha singaporensis]
MTHPTHPTKPTQPTQPTQPERVTLYSKPGCHLCDDARAVVASVCADLDVGWSEVDIQGDEALYPRFWEQIPVTFVDGRQHDFWRVDADRLRAALTAG